MYVHIYVYVYDLPLVSETVAISLKQKTPP